MSAAQLNIAQLTDFVELAFEAPERGVVASLSEFIRIPNVSPIFDPEWDRNGLESRAVAHLAAWCRAQPIAGIQVEVLKDAGLTSLLLVEIPAFRCAKANQSTVLAYAHFDKQPPLPPWADGLAPYEPVVRDGLLFGRGGGDDGYGVYAALTAVAAVQKLGHAHARIVVVVEGSEESGSPHLMHYVNKLAHRIGTPSLVCALDSGCENYEQLWMTSSLRGLVAGTLRVDILTEGIHSGNSGVAASSFRILRRLLDRLEDPDTGAIVADGFSNGIPDEHVVAAQRVAAVVGDAVWKEIPFVAGAQPVTKDNAQLLLNRTWRPMLSVTGVGGMPALKDAGNVLRSHTAVKLSLRLPPNVDGPTAGAKLKALLEHEPPYGAKVSFELEKSGTGWFAPSLAPWLRATIEHASNAVWAKPPQFCGIGGSIPFIYQLGVRFPQAQFVVSGVMGPGSNAHGPNEFISIPYTKKFTCCIAEIIAAHEANAPDFAHVPSFCHFRAGLDTCGKLAPEHVARVAEAGYKTVINLCDMSEDGVAHEADSLVKQGVRFVNVPVSPATFSSAHVDQCAAVLGDAGAAPILFRCASSNRVGGVLAVLHARSGATIDDALAHGQRAGLKSEGMIAATRRVIESERK